jgi:hypothetical protein
MASSAVGVEDLLSIVNVSGKGGLDGKSESDGSGGGHLLKGMHHMEKVIVREKIDVKDITIFTNQLE